MNRLAAIIIVGLVATPAMAQHRGNSYTIEDLELDNARTRLHQQQFENYQLQLELNRERAAQREQEFQRSFRPTLDWDRCAKDIAYC